MLRYTLDNLGWYEFEGLCQSLLKVKLGLGIEAWGNSGDWGRDAYFSGELRNPGLDFSKGPFLFQCKFVDGANAAGARSDASIIEATRKECTQIKERIVPSVLRNGKVDPAKWTQSPKVYVLLTNAPLSAKTRKKIDEMLHDVLPATNVQMHGGQDICAWLDATPEIVRAFPQLWSIRNIDEMLNQWVNADLLSRSNAALKESREVSKVFVPTEPYSRALDVLTKHHFVVLEGPPEMGKTAIGRMIALSAVTRGWEAIECRGPTDVERAYRPDSTQVFVADDFFGRTEYDTRLVSDWQRELAHIVHLLDSQHWLILTTRAHLLNLAKLVLDLGGIGRKFPAEGEVVVDAGDLSETEKARILYRHFKSKESPYLARVLLRKRAKSIVNNKHFTPERIRRLAVERLPAVFSTKSEASKPRFGHALERMLIASDSMFTSELESHGYPPLREIDKVIDEALSDPTQAMRVSFRNLRPAEKWLMFALVDMESKFGNLPPVEKWRTFTLGDMESKFDSSMHSQSTSLENTYERLCPLVEREPFDDVFSALSQAFVRISENARDVDWVHPSCRDLAISELSRDARHRAHFLEHCSMGGLQLAISTGGGSHGLTEFPLLRSDDDWSALAKRVHDPRIDQQKLLVLLCSGYETVRRYGAVRQMVRFDAQTQTKRLQELLLRVYWPVAIRRLNSNQEWTVELVRIYMMLGVGGAVPEHRPDWHGLWEARKKTALEGALKNDENVWQKAEDIDIFSDLAEMIGDAPIEVGADTVSDVLAVSDVWAKIVIRERSRSSIESEWERGDHHNASRGYERLAEAIGRLGRVVASVDIQERLEEGARHFEQISESLSVEYAPSDDDSESVDVGREGSIDEIFKDL